MIKELSRFFSVLCLFIFAGCTTNPPLVQRAPQACVGSEATIVATLPTADSYDGSKPKGITTIASGGYITDRFVITVSHAVPPNATAEGFTEQKRDSEAHLLLLEADTCGTPLTLAKDAASLNDNLFDCATGNARGTVTAFEASAASKSPLASSAILLDDLAVLPGTFALGDSGKPFCNQSGELAAVLVAIREDSALLIGTDAIRAFLN